MSIEPQTITDLREVGKILAPVLGCAPEVAAACAGLCVAAGFSAWQTPEMVHAISNKPSLSAEARRAVILRSGKIAIRIIESSAARVCIEATREGVGTLTADWTIERARRSGLGGGANWKNYPDRMLAARCWTEIGQSLAADLVGVGAPDDTDIEAEPTPAEVASVQAHAEVAGVAPRFSAPSSTRDAAPTEQLAAAPAPPVEPEVLRKPLIARLGEIMASTPLVTLDAPAKKAIVATLRERPIAELAAAVSEIDDPATDFDTRIGLIVAICGLSKEHALLLTAESEPVRTITATLAACEVIAKNAKAVIDTAALSEYLLSLPDHDFLKLSAALRGGSVKALETCAGVAFPPSKKS